MITFTAAPKPFEGNIGAIQSRAIRSWRGAHPDVEVILYGEGSGISDAAAALGVKHEPRIGTSETGVPRFDAIAEHAARSGRFERQIYLNCDILLPPDLLARLAPIDLPEYLVVGQRIDLSPGVEFEIPARDWPSAIRSLARAARAELHSPTGVDYFVFRRGMWQGLPPLIVGRGGYDGALVAFCLRRGIPVVDATWALPALHQYHDYSHVTGGHTEAHFGCDALFNYRRHDVAPSPPNTADANYQLRGGRLHAVECRDDALRALEIRLRYRWGMKYASYVFRALSRVRAALGLNSQRVIGLDELLGANGSK